MKNMCVLMVGCVSMFAAPVSRADSPSSTDASDGGSHPDAIGQYHLIRVANTQLCVQPQRGTTDFGPLELQPCNGALREQNWLFVNTSSGYAIINNNNGNCIYNASDSPADGTPVSHQGCNIAGTNVFASNSLWKASTPTGETSLMSRVHSRDSGFCLDVPWGDAVAGATLWIWSCNNTAAQRFIVGIE